MNNIEKLKQAAILKATQAEANRLILQKQAKDNQELVAFRTAQESEKRKQLANDAKKLEVLTAENEALKRNSNDVFQTGGGKYAQASLVNSAVANSAPPLDYTQSILPLEKVEKSNGGKFFLVAVGLVVLFFVYKKYVK